jgi:hypothetical protein
MVKDTLYQFTPGLDKFIETKFYLNQGGPQLQNRALPGY